MGRYKYLINHIALFSISNFVSKILVFFLLVPFYTSILTTAEYGIVDIMQVTLLLLVPALTMNMGEAALRFGIERDEKRTDIFWIGLKYCGIATLIVAVIASVSAFFVPIEIKKYLMFFIILFATNALYEFLLLFYQGSEMVPVVVLGSISCTIVMLGSNLFLLLVLKIGLNGYLLAQILSYLVASTVMLLAGKKNLVRQSGKNQELERELLDYGKPMILYSTGSWINNASDRYIVAAICGTAVNGIYGAAYKIPAMLTVFQRIFAQAWQMSATKSYREEDSAEFFSTMYRIYNAFMVLGCSFLIVIVKLLAQFLFRKDFYTAWEFVPPLLISIIFGALTGFLGSICLAYKDSKSMSIATGTGALLNIILNLISVPYMGAMGAAIATAISYYTMYLLAFIFVKRHVTLKLRLVKDYLAYAAVILQAVLTICEVSYVYPVNVFIWIVLVVMYFRETRQIVQKLWNQYARKHKEVGVEGEDEAK